MLYTKNYGMIITGFNELVLAHNGPAIFQIMNIVIAKT